ncbi:MAG: branched-chain amino acid ABC transporter permease [Geminicoccaceae bacterium]|nr:MAG: branched-chain amino acid ABC transporter permease [Geminicoccaceae bacterium]
MSRTLSTTAPPRPTWQGLRLYSPAILVFLGLALVPTFASLGAENYILGLVTRLMILAIAAISLDLLLGHGGLVSFGHAAFLGLGAYTTGILLTEGVFQAELIVLAVIALSALFALVTGAVSLRTSGVYFIMITLAFGQMLFFAASSLAAYGGDDGLTLWDRADLFGTDLLHTRQGRFYATLAVLLATFVVVNAVVDSRFGRVLRAAKENPTRVAALGFDVFRFRLAAYVLAGTICGIAGMLSALQAEFVSPAIMSWQRSGELIVMVVLGGMATRNGALLGALAFVLLEVWLADLTVHWKLIFGPLLVLVVLYAKGGLAALLRPLTAEGRHG